MKLAAVAGVAPVSLASPDRTADELHAHMVRARGPESAHDPGLRQSAEEAAALAHDNGAGLVAVVDHPDADPAILVALVVVADVPHGPDAALELQKYLEASAGADIQDVTRSTTERGHPVVIADRIPAGEPGCQLQAIVVEPAGRRMAVFTLHSTTGRGWLDLAATLGRLVSSVSF